MINSAEDLRERIHELAEHDPDPHRVTDQILMSITHDEAWVIVRATLADFVRREMSKPWSGPEAMHEASSGLTASGQKTPGARVASRIDWIARRLRASVNVSVNHGGRGDYKKLGDCTLDDCANAALNRHRKASDVQAEGTRFEKLAAALEEHDAELVKELPRSVLEGLLR